MKIPEKVAFTKAEKVITVLCEILCALYFCLYIVLMLVGYFSGIAIIMLVVTAVLCGVLTLCTVYPQWTNIVSKPENCSESQFHTIRRGCITALMLFPAIIFVMCLIGKI